jgi:hypothetical protein
VILRDILQLRVQLQAFVLEIITLFDHCVELVSDGVGDELVLDGLFELVVDLHQFIDLNFICFDKMLLVLENSLLESGVERIG